MYDDAGTASCYAKFSQCDIWMRLVATFGKYLLVCAMRQKGAKEVGDSAATLRDSALSTPSHSIISKEKQTMVKTPPHLVSSSSSKARQHAKNVVASLFRNLLCASSSRQGRPSGDSIALRACGSQYVLQGESRT